jgi:5-methylcytosine-specific restriction endonuclease McrA
MRVQFQPAFWKAAPYQIGYGTWRSCKIHRISDEDPKKTLCGKIFAEFYGEILPTNVGAIVDCKVCVRSPTIAERRKAQEEEWRQRSAQYEEERRQQEEERRLEYDAYIRSPKWALLRQRVLARDEHLCQGCRLERATDAHHLTYDRFQEEMLFDLIAVCRSCHEKIHRRLY